MKLLENLGEFWIVMVEVSSKQHELINVINCLWGHTSSALPLLVEGISFSRYGLSCTWR